MSQSGTFEGPTHRTVDIGGGQTATEVTSKGATYELTNGIKATLGEDGRANLSKLDPETARLNKSAFNMLMGEEPEEFMTRLKGMVGSENPDDIADAAVAVLGEREARRQAMVYTGNPLAEVLKNHFDSQGTVEQETAPVVAASLGRTAMRMDDFQKKRDEMDKHLAEISQTTVRGTTATLKTPLSQDAPLEVISTAAESPEVTPNSEPITNLAEKLSRLSGVLSNLDSYSLYESADGTITLTPKGE